MRHLLALDQGTTSSRAIVFDAALKPIAMAQRELQQHFPRSGEVEHDPVEIARDQIECAREAIARAGLTASTIDAIGITNQRETTVIWDRATGVPIHRAIVWQDRRTTAVCEALKASGAEAAVRATTGLVLDPYFSGTKIAWLLDHVPGARDRAERGELAFGTIDTWLIWNLTGGSVHATDPSNASRTLLFNIHSGDWDESMLAFFRVPRALMPRVVASSGVLSTTHQKMFGAAIPIAGIAGDQQAALYGQGCDTPGRAKNTYGTGCFMLMHTGTRAVTSANGLITTRAASEPGVGSAQFALEGSVFIAGAAVQWLRDGLGLISAASEIEALAAQVSDAGGVQFVPAFAGLGAPHWDPRARGTIVGLTRGTTRAHLARAALDAIALQSAELADAMSRDAGLALTELRADGGATANNLLMQLQADVLGIPVLRPRALESTALGAAALAARGIAPIEYPSAPKGLIERVFEPTWSADQRASVRAGWDRAVDRARDWSKD